MVKVEEVSVKGIGELHFILKNSSFIAIFIYFFHTT
jgi:hypothetical protein